MPFQLLDDYPPFPASLHACCSCGAGRRTIGDRPEKVVSLGFEVEIAAENGAATGRDVYAHLCETCALELGRLVGLAAPDTTSAAVAAARIAELEAQSAGTAQELADARGLLDPLLARLQADPAPEAPAPAKKTAAKRA